MPTCSLNASLLAVSQPSLWKDEQVSDGRLLDLVLRLIELPGGDTIDAEWKRLVDGLCC